MTECSLVREIRTDPCELRALKNENVASRPRSERCILGWEMFLQSPKRGWGMTSGCVLDNRTQMDGREPRRPSWS